MRIKLLLVLCLFTILNVEAQKKKPAPKTVVKDEVIYHIFQRSFYDSNGDNHGDLNGIRQKLDYLQNLGVTAVLLTPLYDSPFYHNYFANDFKAIDPKYGTLQDYLALIKDLHKRGMKFYMDMETQYVTQGHDWWVDGVGDLESKYKDYILYDDSAHRKPTTIVYGLDGLKGYDGVFKKITTVNLNSPKVLEYNYQLFKYWMDPNNDKHFDDGVDGFRLDHAMDNLDNKGILPHLFQTFWSPLISKLRKVNPKINIVAEQSNWGSLGQDYFTKCNVDRVFGFRMAFAIRSFNKSQLVKAADSTFLLVSQGKQQIIFLENHDTPRFSFGVQGDIAKLKTGAALNLLLGGIPSIYYGQELGMTGNSAKFGATDANEIPNREAFEWYKKDKGPGMAFWYKQKGPWKDQFNNDKPNDGISLEEEMDDPNSLWYFYREMLSLRKANPVLIKGAYKTLANNNDQVFSFERSENGKRIVIAVNLSDRNQDVAVQLSGKETKLNRIRGIVKAAIVPAAKTGDPNTIKVNMSPNGVEVWGLE